MLRIFVSRQTRYPAEIKKIKDRVSMLLTSRGVSDALVSVALVGERKIKELASKYLGEENTVHEVLSFPNSDVESPNGFVTPPGLTRLGDIVICYPEARKIAMNKNRMVDDVLCELAEHGTMHLLGIHHE